MSQPDLERTFTTYWNIYVPNYEPVEQCYFSLDRDWRFDVAVVEKLLAVEIHGGGFVRGRHHRESGMSDDFEKHNTATALGWRIIYCTSSMLENDPESIFKPILSLLNHPVLFPDAEHSMWIARIRNLTHIGDSILHNGITVIREKRNTFQLKLSEKNYLTHPQKTLIEGQKEALNLILKGFSVSATPISLQNQSRTQSQMTLFT